MWVKLWSCDVLTSVLTLISFYRPNLRENGLRISLFCFIIIINDMEQLWQWPEKSLFIDATSIVDEVLSAKPRSLGGTLWINVILCSSCVRGCNGCLSWCFAFVLTVNTVRELLDPVSFVERSSFLRYAYRITAISIIISDTMRDRAVATQCDRGRVQIFDWCYFNDLDWLLIRFSRWRY